MFSIHSVEKQWKKPDTLSQQQCSLIGHNCDYYLKKKKKALAGYLTLITLCL